MRLKELRNQKGMSQEVLADISGLSLRTIQRIENGETNPTGESLKRLSNALNVNPDELIDWAIKDDKNRTFRKSYSKHNLYYHRNYVFNKFNFHITKCA